MEASRLWRFGIREAVTRSNRSAGFDWVVRRNCRIRAEGSTAEVGVDKRTERYWGDQNDSGQSSRSLVAVTRSG